jgi:dienelactone hydrolase
MSCPACFTGTKHEHGTTKGTIEPLYGLPTYITTPPSNTTPESTILFLTDAFGLKLINSKLLADHYAAETGCKVLMPDILPGGGASPAYIGKIAVLTEPVGWTDLWGQLNRIWAGAQFVPLMVGFRYRATAPKVYPRMLEYARAVRKDLPAGGKIGVCWGGYGSTMLCIETREDGEEESLIDAQFCAHPSKLD